MSITSTSAPRESQEPPKPVKKGGLRSGRFWLILLLAAVDFCMHIFIGNHQFTPVGLVLVFLGLIPAIFALRAGISWERHRRQLALEKILKRSGTSTIGQVDERRVIGKERSYQRSKSLLGRSPYILIYSYECQGNRYQGSQEVFQEIFDIWKDGSTVMIRYASDDPQKAMVEGIPHVYPAAHVEINIVCFFFIAALFLFFSGVGIFIMLFPPK